MKKKDSDLIGPLLERFFVDFLASQKRVSPETIASYRDTFRLLLCYINEKYSVAPAAARVSDLDVPVILSFLEYLEQDRQNSIKSRNQRLAAIRSFFRIVALSDPASVNQSSRVLAIPLKRTDRLLVKSLSREEIDAILAVPDLHQWSGRRDHALLLTMYNTGARVSEMIAMEKSHFTFGTTTFVRIHGKGRKERTIPLWARTARTLQAWFSESVAGPGAVFPNSLGKGLTRNGVDYILQHAIKAATSRCPTLRDKKITPHMVRHTTATHLLQSGTDLSVIALWLGHESLETTHTYVEADLATKERALNKVAPAGTQVPRLKVPDEVLAFLARL